MKDVFTATLTLIAPLEHLLLAWCDALIGLALVLMMLGRIARMNPKTRESVRWAHIILALGAFLMMVGPAFNYHVTHVQDLVLHFGVLLVLVFERRRPSDCPEVEHCDMQTRGYQPIAPPRKP